MFKVLRYEVESKAILEISFIECKCSYKFTFHACNSRLDLLERFSWDKECSLEGLGVINSDVEDINLIGFSNFETAWEIVSWFNSLFPHDFSLITSDFHKYSYTTRVGNRLRIYSLVWGLFSENKFATH